MKPKSDTYEGIPGIESERIKGAKRLSLIFSLTISAGLFCLLPLSEFIRADEWLVRTTDAPMFSPPPPPKSKMEEKVEKDSHQPKPVPKLLKKAPIQLDTIALDATLEVGPGDFQSAFSLVSFNPNSEGLEQELIFSLHELDRNPSIIRQGVLRYPAHLKRKGLEGEVKLLIQIDEKGKVQVMEIVSSSHPDFIKPSRDAAESSIYESPKRNGVPVKVQFYLPVRFSLLQ